MQPLRWYSTLMTTPSIRGKRGRAMVHPDFSNPGRARPRWTALRPSDTTGKPPPNGPRRLILIPPNTVGPVLAPVAVSQIIRWVSRDRVVKNEKGSFTHRTGIRQDRRRCGSRLFLRDAGCGLQACRPASNAHSQRARTRIQSESSTSHH